MTRWVTAHGAGHAQWYIDRCRRMAAQGVDLDGEAWLLDVMLARRSPVLDAGCGPGRVGAGPAARGHVVVGVDADPALIEAAHADHPGPTWRVADRPRLIWPRRGSRNRSTPKCAQAT
ncbi:class I SAM-dependent methyltransferase [Lapillicoccus sp.]|uniref:class I SAM-dependent methyltransferase n=1 Tax=Lapillicoccus sp. TaxID=1909287 RepID=UPI0039835E72